MIHASLTLLAGMLRRELFYLFLFGLGCNLQADAQVSTIGIATELSYSTVTKPHVSSKENRKIQTFNHYRVGYAAQLYIEKPHYSWLSSRISIGYRTRRPIETFVWRGRSLAGGTIGNVAVGNLLATHPNYDGFDASEVYRIPNFHFAEASYVAKTQVNWGKQHELSFGLGAILSFLLNKQQLTLSPEDIGPSVERFLDPTRFGPAPDVIFSRRDVQATGLVGYTFLPNKRNWSLELEGRFTHGFIRVQENDVWQENNKSSRWRSISTSITYARLLFSR